MEQFLHRHRRAVLLAIVTLSTSFGLLFAFGTRPWRGPDEDQHYRYAALLAEKRKLPMLWVTTEAHQPPLYYWLLQPLFLATPGWTAEDRLLLLRAFSVALGALSVLFIHHGARRFAGDRSLVPWMATLLVAFNPQYLWMNATVNSDALANVLGAALFLLLVQTCLAPHLSAGRALLHNATVLAALLTKVLLWPAGLLLLLVTWLRSRKRLAVVHVACFAALAFVLRWWLLRNVHLYGDPLAYRALRDLWYEDQHRDFLSLSGLRTWLATLVESFWARFNHFTLVVPPFFYRALKAVLGFAGIGFLVYLVRSVRTLRRGERLALLCLALSVAGVAAGVFLYNLRFYQPQGRYLFPVIGDIALIAALGLHTLLPDRLRIHGTALLAAALLFFSVESVVLVWQRG